jgi:hypothetical protein
MLTSVPAATVTLGALIEGRGRVHHPQGASEVVPQPMSIGTCEAPWLSADGDS